MPLRNPRPTVLFLLRRQRLVPAASAEPRALLGVPKRDIALLASAAAAAAAPDFFSLDVDAESEILEQYAAPSPAREPGPETQAGAAELPRLESVWFRGNSIFKSPMLQLHKGVSFISCRCISQFHANSTLCRNYIELFLATAEILDFCNFLSPTPEEHALRNSAVESVFGVIKYIWSNCTVEVFGSYRTGLFLPTSDIDILRLKVKSQSILCHVTAFRGLCHGHFFRRAHDILMACNAYMEGAQVGSLVRGVQDVDVGEKGCSSQFKQTLVAYVGILGKAFMKIGVKDCEKFLTPPPGKETERQVGGVAIVDPPV